MDVVMTAMQAFSVFVTGLVVRLLLPVVAGLVVLSVPVFLIVGLQRLRVRREPDVGLEQVSGYTWAGDAGYAPGHTWVRAVSGGMRVGLDDLAQRLLGDTDAVELPPPGTLVTEGEVAGVVRCGDKRGAIASPLTGTVTAVNDEVARDPSLIHRQPYTGGWLFAVAPTGGTARMRHGAAARAWLADEAARLTHFLERDLGLAAADGGEILAPPPSLLTAEQWRALSASFLAPAMEAVAPRRVEATRPAERPGPRHLARGVLGAVAGGVYVLLLPAVGAGAIVYFAALKAWQLLVRASDAAFGRRGRQHR